MRLEGIGQVLRIAAPFDRAAKELRRAIREEGMSIVQEIDLTRELGGGLEQDGRRSTLLFVDCPLLLFEAVALDRASAVFIPFHVVVSGDQRDSEVRWTHPASALDLRVPAPAKNPMDLLFTRLTDLMERTVSRPEGQHKEVEVKVQDD